MGCSTPAPPQSASLACETHKQPRKLENSASETRSCRPPFRASEGPCLTRPGRPGCAREGAVSRRLDAQRSGRDRAHRAEGRAPAPAPLESRGAVLAAGGAGRSRRARSGRGARWGGSFELLRPRASPAPLALPPPPACAPRPLGKQLRERPRPAGPRPRAPRHPPGTPRPWASWPGCCPRSSCSARSSSAAPGELGRPEGTGGDRASPPSTLSPVSVPHPELAPVPCPPPRLRVSVPLVPRTPACGVGARGAVRRPGAELARRAGGGREPLPAVPRAPHSAGPCPAGPRLADALLGAGCALRHSCWREGRSDPGTGGGCSRSVSRAAPQILVGEQGWAHRKAVLGLSESESAAAQGSPFWGPGVCRWEPARRPYSLEGMSAPEKEQGPPPGLAASFWLPGTSTGPACSSSLGT